MSIKSRIKDLASTHGVSIAEHERKLNFANGSITKWDKQSPSSERLQAVADYFDVSVDYLLGREKIKDDIDIHISGTGLFRKAVQENKLSESEQKDLAKDMDAYLKFRAEQLRNNRG